MGTEIEPEVDMRDEVELLEPEQEDAISPERLARRDAALRKVRKYGDPVLRSKALPVELFDDALRAEVGHMEPIMDDAFGTGLAAPQLGVLHRLFIYRIGLEGQLKVIINPELEWVDEETTLFEEGCLSLPGVHLELERPARVRVRAQDLDGNEFKLEAEELEARVIQHELDHLDGVLILDRCSKVQRKEAIKTLRERLRPYPG